MVSQMVHGTIQSTIMGMYVGAVTSAPVIPADVDATGAVILYLGTSDDTFENGRFYRFGDGAWSEAPVGATFDLTPGKVVVSDAEGNLITSDLDSTALGNLTGLTGNVQTQIDAVESDVSSQGTRLTTAEGEIDTLQGTVSSQGTAITTAEGEIDTLQSQMGTANSNISSLQGAVAGKQDAITGGATTILTQNLGASKALISDASGKVAISNVSATELGYVAGVTSSIQTQLDNLSSLISAMGGFSVQIVNELPGTGQPNTIYFVPSDSGAGQNIKDEYMWLNNAWEQIGSTQFSLNIVQNASGITINGTALQTATTARAGIMTPTEVQAIDALNTNLGLAEDDIDTLQSQMGTANSNISTLQSQMAQKVDNNDLATTSSSGLMSASDKVKLNGIATNANRYVLPVAGSSLGGVKNGGNVVIDSSGKANVNLSGYATTSALNAKADKTTVTELSNNLSTMDSRVSALEEGGSGIDTISARSSGSVSTISFAEGSDNKLTMVISPSTTDADNGFKVNTITPSAIGEANFTFVSDVSGSVSDGKLKITVNGVSSDDIPLPQTDISDVYMIGGVQIGTFGIYVEMKKGFMREIVSGSVNSIQPDTITRQYCINNYIFGSDISDRPAFSGINKITYSNKTSTSNYKLPQGSHEFASSNTIIGVRKISDFNNVIQNFTIKNAVVAIVQYSNTIDINKNCNLCDISFTENNFITSVDICCDEDYPNPNLYVFFTENTIIEV